MRVVIFGKGGASREVASWIEHEIVGYVESEDLSLLDNPQVEGIVIPISMPSAKKKVYTNEILPIESLVVKEQCKLFEYPNCVHPNAQVHLGTTLYGRGEGNIICSNSILNVSVKLGNFNLVNYSCTIGHDTKIGSYNVINPQACISGGVEIGNCCLIGANATILQYLKIGNNVTVGAGAVVTKDVGDNTTVVGVPAKEIK